MGSPHGERAFLGLWKFFKKKVAHGKVKNSISEKFENLIRNFVRSVGLMDEGRVGERPIQPYTLFELIS
jgi:hypothetical protein